MVKPRTLRNAPITEAVIDFNVEVPTSVNVTEALSEVDNKITAKYPKVHTQISLEGEMNLHPENPTMRQLGEHKVTGKIYQTEDDLQVAQFRLDGFTFNRLAPYTNWSEVLPEVMDLWEFYCKAYSPTLISQLSVRFINHITIPTSVDHLSDYFAAPIQIPESLSHKIASFLTRVTVIEDEPDTYTDITQALGQGSNETQTLTLLEISSYQTFENLKPQDEKIITSTLNKLRDIKNRTFFGSITERTVELYL